MWLYMYTNILASTYTPRTHLQSNYHCYFAVHYTMPPAETTSSGANQAMFMESWTPSVGLVTTAAHQSETSSFASQMTTGDFSTENTDVMTRDVTPPPATTPTGLTFEPTREREPSFRLSPCTLATASAALEICATSQPTFNANSALADQIKSTLLDDDLSSCMNPFQSRSQMLLVVTTQASSLLRIQVAGHGLDCLHPSTVVYMDIGTTPGQGTVTHEIQKQECLYVSSSLEGELVSCIYECRPLFPCNGSARFGVQFERFSWLPRSKSLKQLCDIRAFKHT